MTRAGRVLLALLLPLVVGCAETARLPRPEDLPFHATDDPFFNLHWRLDRTPEEVRAVGLVEAARADGVGQVIVELRELNAGGQIISSAAYHTYGKRLSQWDWWPFTVRLQPKSQDDRFEVKVRSFSWAVGGCGH